MYKNEKINKIQLAAILFNTMLGVEVLSLPTRLATELGPDGSISIVIGGLIASILVAIIASISIKYPDKSMADFGKELVPAPIANIITAIYIFEFIVIGSLVLRLTSQVVSAFLLVNTPSHVTGASMLLVVIYLVRGGIEPMGRMFIIATLLLILPLVFVGTAVYSDVRFENFLPMFQFTPMQMIKSVRNTITSYSGFQILFFILFFVKEDKKKTIKYSVGATLLIMLLYVVIFLTTLGKYGTNKMQYQLWPVMSLMRSIQIPTAFIENIDISVMSVWIITVFTTLASILFGASFVLSKLTKGNEQKVYVIPITILMYLIAYAPRNLAEVYYYSNKVLSITSIVTIFICPILYFIISKVKKKEEACGK